MLLQRRPRFLIIAGAVAATGACNDQRAPTALRPGVDAMFATGGNAKVKVKALQLSTNTLRIDGPAVTATVSVGNSGTAIEPGVSIRAEIVQGTATRQAANVLTQCQPSDPAGVLPNGSCDMTIPATASNTATGSGTLVPGAATLVVRVLQTVPGSVTELASKTVDVNLVATPTITTLNLASTTLPIDGPSVNYTATLQNPANSLQGVLLQGVLVQGAVSKGAGGLSVSCGAAIGVLPPGTCTINFTATASNSVGGTLVPGPAQFQLNLIQSNGGTNTTFDTKIVQVTLVSSAPKITSLVLASTDLPIGISVDYTVQLQNPGLPLSDILLQGEINQGAVTHGAGGFSINCGSGLGVLPTTGTGTCSLQFTAIASNTAGGGGTLVPGPANFVLRMYRAPVGGPLTELDSKTVAVTLVSPNPRIVSVTPASSFIVLGAGFTTYTAAIQNPGPALTNVTTQGWIRQGSARRAAGGTQILCAGVPPNNLPTGACAAHGDIVGGNEPNAGTGTLVLGPATYELELKHFDGTTETIFDTKSIPITLVATTPSIVSVVLTSTTLPIGVSTQYTATLFNPSGAALSSVVLIQGEMAQGTTVHAAGGTVLTCGPVQAEMPPGVCVMTFTAIAQNDAGAGTLVAGPAQFTLKLYHNGTVLDSYTTAVTLTSP